MEYIYLLEMSNPVSREILETFKNADIWKQGAPK